MQFRTQVPIRTYDHPIDYGSQIVSLGSCFAVNIAEKFGYLKFQNLVNPFGILFHPLAIADFLSDVANQHTVSHSDIFIYNQHWQSFGAHSELNDEDPEILIARMNAALQITHTSLSSATHVIITLGTAWVYRHIETDQIVANCHKVPQKHFKKELLSVAVLCESINRIVSSIAAINPDAQIIFTISPVRHAKDGFVENQRSKSHLFTALHNILDVNSHLNYFPSYEILMDELRDYRFYASDMLHPNSIAIDYIWQQFSENYISKHAKAILTEVDSIQRALQHRPFNPQSAQHLAFTENLSNQIATLQKQIPHITF